MRLPWQRRTYEEQLAEIREEYGPPPISGSCNACGAPANTEITWYFRPSDLCGTRTVHRFCDVHGREAHNAIAPFFGWEEAA